MPWLVSVGKTSGTPWRAWPCTNQYHTTAPPCQARRIPSMPICHIALFLHVRGHIPWKGGRVSSTTWRGIDGAVVRSLLASRVSPSPGILSTRCQCSAGSGFHGPGCRPTVPGILMCCRPFPLSARKRHFAGPANGVRMPSPILTPPRQPRQDPPPSFAPPQHCHISRDKSPAPITGMHGGAHVH